jgi:mRNA degradation ribonuclease J1/J2
LYGFGEPVQLHASGHAPGNQLVEMIETINPETLIPVHTENPQWFKNKHPNTKQVKLNATIII